MESDETYLKTKKQAARFLGISEYGIERLMRAGLPYVRVGSLVRFRPEDLSSYIEQRRIVKTSVVEISEELIGT